MLRKWLTMTFVLSLLASANSRYAQAELLLAEDFFYAETPNKPLGAIEGFEFGDYGGGYGQWDGLWASVLSSTITGPGCLAPECNGPDDLYHGVTGAGGPNVLDRDYTMPADAGNTIYFGGRIRDTAGANSSATIYLQGATVTNFNNFVELDGNSIGVGLFQGGLRGFLGSTVNSSADSISSDGEFHTIIGKLQVNANGANESLTVWLNPTGTETGGKSLTVNNVDVVASTAALGSIDGSPLRLWTNGGISHFDDIAVGTTWADVAGAVVPRPTLEINAKSGYARLKNASGKTFESIFMSLQSESGSLLTGGWNSLTDQGTPGWAENKSNSKQLVESQLSGTTPLANGANIGLGPIWWKGATALDIIPQFGVASGLLNRLNVTTIPGTFASDFNDDGAVDAADAGIMFAGWGNARNVGDLNGDNVVDAADAGDMFAEWTGDPNTPAAKAATAEYNVETGELKISSAGAVNVFVQSASNAITPVNPAPAVPVGLLTNNTGRVGITNLGPIDVTNFSFGNIGKGLAMSDLKLVYTTALGTKGIEVPASAESGAAFKYIPEPASLSLIGLGLAGLLATRRR